MTDRNRNLAIGVDLGATKIALALANPQGEVLLEKKIWTKAEDGVPSVIRRLGDEIEALTAVAPAPVTGVGIGVPGYIDPAEGVVVDATNLSWYNVPLLADLRRRLGSGMPILVQMDTFASALGEYYLGAARGCKNLLYLSIGSGFSAGLIAEGKLITGQNNLAGQCGYYSLARRSLEPGPLGPRDTAEEVLSGYGFLTVTRRLLAEGKLPSRLADTPDLSTKAILDAARGGDPLAGEVIDEAASTLAIVLSAYLTFLNPEAAVIGGGLGMAAFDLLMPALSRELKRRVIDVYYTELKVLPSGQASSALGAACMVFRQTCPEIFEL